ncbi:MAG: carboxypeptidase-like regulatory domain-containing protein [Thermodesulfobacteriota bacterium]
MKFPWTALLLVAALVLICFLPACPGGGGGGSEEQVEKGNQLWFYAPGAGYTATVTAPGGNFSCNTDNSGECRVRDIPNGRYSVEARQGNTVRKHQTFTWTGHDKHQFWL